MHQSLVSWWSPLWQHSGPLRQEDFWTLKKNKTNFPPWSNTNPEDSQEFTRSEGRKLARKQDSNSSQPWNSQRFQNTHRKHKNKEKSLKLENHGREGHREECEKATQRKEQTQQTISLLVTTRKELQQLNNKSKHNT